MKAPQRQWAILGILLLVWGGLLVARWGRSAPPAPRAEGPRVTRADARAAKTPATIPGLRTDLLRAVRAPLPVTPKNLFAAVEEPPPPALAAKPIAPALPPPDPFLEGLKGLKFLGFALEGGRMLAFLSRGGEFLMAREKELLLNQYLVARIAEDSILLTAPDGSREARLSLSPEAR